MSQWLESCVVLTVMSIMVALFAWIYLRDRHARGKLWLLGWIAVLIHFIAPPLGHASILSPQLQDWIMIATLIVAGTCFLLSVSEVFAALDRRFEFLCAISLACLIYLTALMLGVQSRWLYVA